MNLTDPSVVAHHLDRALVPLRMRRGNQPNYVVWVSEKQGYVVVIYYYTEDRLSIEVMGGLPMDVTLPNFDPSWPGKPKGCPHFDDVVRLCQDNQPTSLNEFATLIGLIIQNDPR